MRKKLKKVAAIALSCLMAAGVMTGCGSSKGGIGTKTNDGNKVLFQYDGEKVTLKEGWLYAKLIAAQYESTYSSTYGKDFWKMDMGHKTADYFTVKTADCLKQESRCVWM